MTSRAVVATFRAMANGQPDDATGDGVILARAHTFLAALLAFLGFKNLPTDTVATMLDDLTGWLDMAKAVRRDLQGVVTKFWRDAFFEAWKAQDAAKASDAADAAVVEFNKRFLPVNADDRDTLDTADFDSLREQLDEADRYKSEICDALDGRDGAKGFYHAQLVEQLRAERDAILRANAHHASEIEQLRNERDALKKVRAVDLSEMATLANALDGVRVAINGKSLPDVDVPNAVAVIVQERDALRAQLASAIVPLPKPERVESGQLWSMLLLCDWPHADGKGGTFFKPNGERIELWPRDIQDSALQFTGTR